MRTRVMKKRGRKITAILLAFAMVLPMAWSQTVVTEAAGTDSDYLTLTSKDGASTPMELGDQFTLELKAKKDFQAATSIDGNLSYSENGVVLDDCFTIKEVVTPKNWGYSYDAGSFAISTSVASASSFKSGAVIATITFEVTRAVDKADIVYTLNNFKAQDSAGLSFSEKDKTVTCATISNSKVPRKVTFEMDSDITARVSQNYSANKVVEIPVRIKAGENSGFNTLMMEFTYDSSLMMYKGFEIDAKARAYLSCVTERDDNSGTVSLAFAGAKDAKFTGKFITLKFIAMQSSIGSTDTLTGKVTEMYNVSQKPLTATNFSSTIHFEKGFDLGDVDMNGTVNLLDVTLALQAYNEVRTLTADQIELADVNKDGDVTLVDVLLILKKCNGEYVNF